MIFQSRFISFNKVIVSNVSNLPNCGLLEKYAQAGAGDIGDAAPCAVLPMSVRQTAICGSFPRHRGGNGSVLSRFTNYLPEN